MKPCPFLEKIFFRIVVATKELEGPNFGGLFSFAENWGGPLTT